MTMFFVLASNHDRLAAVVAAIVALLLAAPYLAIRALMLVDEWLDHRYRRETPESAAWERHCRTTPGLLDRADEAEWEAELRFSGPLHHLTRARREASGREARS